MLVKQMNNLYNIVKTAIDKNIQLSLTASKYYLSKAEAASNLLCKKAIVATNSDKSKTIYKINTYDDYIHIIKKGTVSIYEPVDSKTNSFRILFANDNLSTSETLSAIKIIADRFEEIGFKTNIIKSNGNFGIKCIAKTEFVTDKLYAFASDLTNGLNANLDELKFGKLKRFYYSLDDNGNEDANISIGTI